MPPAATALPSGAGSAPVNSQSFTQFLNEQPSMQPPPAQAEPAPGKPEAPPEHGPEAPPAPDGPDANTTRLNRDRGLVKKPVAPIKVGPDTAAAMTDKAKADKAALAGKAGDVTTAAKVDTEKADKAAPADDAPETSGLNEFTQLIGLTPPAQPASPADGVGMAITTPACVLQEGAEHGAPADEDADTGSAARVIDTGLPTQQPTERRSDAQIRLADTSQRGKPIEAFNDKATSRAVTASPTDALQTAPAALAAAASASTPAAAAPNVGTPNFAAMLAQALPGNAAPADVASTGAYGQVHAPVHSSAFGAELGARVSLLAVDGLQTAELQLNPADMGPVSVQIVMDGSQAQVSFHAAQAETRQALEQSLPDLAAALQGQGLTLSGGGVFQQAPRDSNPSSGNDDTGSRSPRVAGSGNDRTASAAGTHPPLRRAVGLLDTFA